MRSDMAKVIVEKARRGGGVDKSRRDEKNRGAVLRVVRDPEHHDEPRSVESMKTAHSHNAKELNENLNPLRKFFESRVGKRWNSVYSEVREHLDVGSAVKQHVADHIKDMVELHAVIRDGVIGNFGYGGQFTPIYGLYVHPVTGLLNRAKQARRDVRWRQATKHPMVRHPTDRLVQYRCIGEVWYRIDLAATPILRPAVSSVAQARHYTDTRHRLYEKIADVVFPEGTSEYTRKVEYGDAGLHAAKKTQCGRKELKLIRGATK